MITSFATEGHDPAYFSSVSGVLFLFVPAYLLPCRHHANGAPTPTQPINRSFTHHFIPAQYTQPNIFGGKFHEDRKANILNNIVFSFFERTPRPTPCNQIYWTPWKNRDVKLMALKRTTQPFYHSIIVIILLFCYIVLLFYMIFGNKKNKQAHSLSF